MFLRSRATGIFILSRYLATVRRETSYPFPTSAARSFSSLSGWRLSSASTSSLISASTSLLVNSPPSSPRLSEKKNRSGEYAPRRGGVFVVGGPGDDGYVVARQRGNVLDHRGPQRMHVLGQEVIFLYFHDCGHDGKQRFASLPDELYEIACGIEPRHYELPVLPFLPGSRVAFHASYGIGESLFYLQVRGSRNRDGDVFAVHVYYEIRDYSGCGLVPPVPSDAPGFGLRFSIRSIAFFTRSGEAFIRDMMRCECFIVNSEK